VTTLNAIMLGFVVLSALWDVRCWVACWRRGCPGCAWAALAGTLALTAAAVTLWRLDRP